MTTPPQTGTRIDVASELTAAGLTNVDTLAEQLTALDADDVRNGAADTQALSTVAVLLARAGANSRTLSGLIKDQELSHAGALLDYGLSGKEILTAGENEWLRDVVTAMDAGCTLDDVLAIAHNTNLGAGELPALLHTGMPRTLIPVIGAGQAGRVVLTKALTAGATWDDIAWMLTTPGAYGDRLHKYAAFTADHADVPADVRRLAAALSASTVHSALDLLPAAAAITGQPWEATVLTLLSDTIAAGDRAPWAGTVHPHVLAARALDTDPHLPELTPSTPPAPFAAPACLQRQHPDRDATLEARLVAADVDPATITDAVTWLGRHAPALAVREGPEYGSWNVTDLDAVTCAFAAGASVTDLRLACTIIDRTGSLGLPRAAYVLAAGVSLRTAEQWAASDADVTAAALLVGYGMSAREAAQLAVDDASAWHAIDLLAGGVAAHDVHRLLPVVAGRATDTLWGVHTGPGMPIPFAGLSALAEHGLTLTGVNLGAWQKLIADIPDDAATTALVTSGRLDAGGHALPLLSALTYACAVTGQPWADHVTLPASAPDGPDIPDIRVALTQQVLTARGLTPTSRAITRPAAGTTARTRTR